MEFYKYFLGLCLLFSNSAAEEDKCTVCGKIVDRFQMGLVKTAKSNFGGGNSQWEEQKLGRYEYSETRFLEVMEAVCPDGEKNCHSMLEELEETFERWWKKYYALEVESDLRDFMCVRKLKVCCNKGTHGRGCVDCPGGRRSPCGSNGVCQGDGTKRGSGECACDMGYEGDVCERCSSGFYPSSSSSPASFSSSSALVENKLECVACHSSCKGTCRGEGVGGCVVCKDGWVWVDGVGCSDIDECEDETMCSRREVCVNKEGGYRCVACDKACNSCRGESHHDCIQCATLYYMSSPHHCLPCHQSCSKSCTDSTSGSCQECSIGYFMGQDGCQDLDECKKDGRKDKVMSCELDEYCINTVGSFKCSTCHTACDGCEGSGNSGCVRCKTGYHLVDGSCQDIDECVIEGMCVGFNRHCINVPGSYLCDCVHGFVPDSEGVCVPSRSIKGKDRQKTAPITTQATTKQPPTSPVKKKKTKKIVTKGSELFSYFLRLFVFVFLSYCVSSFISLQAIFTAFFSVYLYHYVSQLDDVLKNAI